jgi:hypothetical protein
MNVAKAYEIALAVTIRQFADIGGATVIRCWQSLREDPLWNKGGVDKVSDAILIRATPPRTNDDQVTLVCDAAVDLTTNTAEDADHASISGMYAGVQETLDRLMAQWKSGTGDEFEAFAAAMAEALQDDDDVYSFGGFAFGEAVSPYDDDGFNAMGVTLQLHYSRSDFT